MKILLVNTYDTGGAANACIRLHEGLLQQGVDSKLLVLKKSKDLPQSFEYYKKTPIYKKIVRKLNSIISNRIKSANDIFFKSIAEKKSFFENRHAALEMYSFPTSTYDITQSPYYKEADIINLHWVAGFIDYESFFKKNTKPVVWTLHDMNPFSSGEHYDETIIGVDVKGNPVLRTVNELERTVYSKVENYKYDILKKNQNIEVVAPSLWLHNESKKSKVFGNFVNHLIPNGLHIDKFQHLEKIHSRDSLDLPKDKKIILFVADDVERQRKGFDFLLNAISKLNNPEILLIAVGHPTEQLNDFQNVIQLGYIKDTTILNQCYCAADVFIIPSLMDNLPNTVIESLFCGTPVIGFKIGGIKDMVEPGFNGLLLPNISSDSLGAGITEFFESLNQYDSALIRKEAIERYQLEKQASSYKNLFNSILKG